MLFVEFCPLIWKKRHTIIHETRKGTWTSILLNFINFINFYNCDIFVSIQNFDLARYVCNNWVYRIHAWVVEFLLRVVIDRVLGVLEASMLKAIIFIRFLMHINLNYFWESDLSSPSFTRETKRSCFDVTVLIIKHIFLHLLQFNQFFN